jgi:DNA-binding NarL/FixJ family response regulator
MSLTESELGVARLAAEGLTNRQIGDRLFNSRRTVETHLAHVFGKLGINSRAQLAAEVARRDSLHATVSKSSASRVPGDAPRRMNHS